MQPDPGYLLRKMEMNYPLIGAYVTDDAEPFAPFGKSKHCLFEMYSHWKKGLSLQLSAENFTCMGSGRSLCNVDTRPRDQFIDFLANKEGLKASEKLMEAWIDASSPFALGERKIVLGPLKSGQYHELTTVTFFVNPDQLSLLTIGAQYFSAPDDPAPVIAPFGAGCMQLLSIFRDLEIPQAAIGATDLAMRQHLPADVLAFTVTRPMFERLCRLDENSFLEKHFLKRLIAERGKLATN